MYQKILLALFLCNMLTSAIAQENPIAATPAEVRLQGLTQREMLSEKSWVANVPFRSIGPSVFSCRVADIDVSPKDPSHFYVAYASGGLWKTESNGNHFTPLFDNEAVMSIGDIAVNWDKNIIWVGTGENISSRSSYSGVGMYRSDDGGKTWQHRGLNESHHIGRVVLHPTNTDVVWVAALGHLYSPNKARGIYKTTDGGKTWRNTLFINENTGGIDLITDPDNPNILYAVMWERTRRAWNFTESGTGSGIYKSTDGGETWKNITESGQFPSGAGMGRTGIDIYKKNGKTVLYVVTDNQAAKKDKKKKDEEGLTKAQLRKMSKEDFLKLDKEKIDDFLKNNDFPEKYKANDVLEGLKTGKYSIQTLLDYLNDANASLFETEVTGAEVYRSDDEGKTWKRTHDEPLDDVYYTYGYVFGQIRVSPHDPNKIYIMGVPILRSNDGGKTFKSINQENVHADHHPLWENPARAGHLINGNDGGLNMSYDDGEHWFKLNSPPVGQFYSIQVDMETPYNVYGGTQDNGVWVGSSANKETLDWHDSGQYPFKSIMGGDGMQIQIDKRDNNTVYTGFQFGNYFKINKATRESKSITPKHDLGEKPFRWNWQTPILLSPHNQDIFYMGSHKLHRSMDKAETFEAISDDLTHGEKTGDVPYGTLVAIDESKFKFGLIYTGSDDGYIHVTHDGGNTWKRISDALPQNLYVSRVQASKHDKATVFATLNGYRWDDMTAYVYRSTNYGNTWTAIGKNLPAEPVNVIREDPNNANILYVGTDHGVYISLDKGASFMRMSKNLPAAPVHDLVIHQRDAEMVVGTHGRSMFVANVKEIQQLDDKILGESFYAFDIRKQNVNQNWGHTWNKYMKIAAPEKDIPVFLKDAGNVKITIKTENGLVLRTWTQALPKGLNYITYSCDVDEKIVKDYEKALNEAQKEKKKPIKVKKADSGKYYIQKGTYKVELEKDGKKVEKDMIWE